MIRFASLLGLACAVCLRAGAAEAYCPPETDYSVRGEFARADYVGVVRVTGATWLDEEGRPTKLHGHLMLGAIPGGFDPYSGADYEVAPERTFKGAAARSLTIFSENTEARTPLKVGASYLVFLERQSVGDEDRRVGDLMIDYCGNSALLRHAGPALSVIQHSADYDDLEAFLAGYVAMARIRVAGTRYSAAFADLTGDGRTEVVVYLSDGGWCGSGGCTTLVLARRDGGYKLVSKIAITHLPIRALRTASHGWRDLGVVVEGGGIRPSYEAAIPFDGNSYPSTPTAPPARRLAGKQGHVLIPDDDPGRPIPTAAQRNSRTSLGGEP